LRLAGVVLQGKLARFPRLIEAIGFITRHEPSDNTSTGVIGPFRKRMIDDMQIFRPALKTRDGYLRVIRHFTMS
jgi:hypothetical protein